MRIFLFFSCYVFYVQGLCTFSHGFGCNVQLNKNYLAAKLSDTSVFIGHNDNTPTWQDCCLLCNTNPQCVSWTWHDPTLWGGPSRCRLFKRMPAGSEMYNENICTSGYKPATACTDNCQNGGTCTTPSESCSGSICSCVAGTTGTNCQTDINECSSNPCVHGTCNQPALDQWSCTCNAGWTGTTCNTDVNECSSNPCTSGVCVHGVGTDEWSCAFVCGDGILDPGEECDDGNTVSADGCQFDCKTPICGDNIVDSGETCDDGNTVSADGCQANCQLAACGDSIVDPGEQCDDGNTVDADGCQGDCQNPACGDGILDTGEQCDDNNLVDADGCQSTCMNPVCGDGITDSGEQCDDGNNVNADGCQGNCLNPVCGDNIVDAGEECDDGNTVNADGCQGDCKTPVCGDNILDSGEQCDDGNTVNADGCQGNCLNPVCGDGIVDSGEECDDGNTVNADGCQGNCKNPGNRGTNCFSLEATDLIHLCGDGILDSGEECDDSNTINADGCQGDCKNPIAQICPYKQNLPVCGDNIVDSGEQCDDGNTANADGCQGNCQNPVCGDSIVDSGEECDDGNTVNADGCQGNCKNPNCGDGIVDSGEECDDSNTIDADGCQGDCKNPICGDTIVDTGEQCDDGNTVNADGCQGNCQNPVCGDGIVDSGEECDDGNTVNADGCQGNCKNPFCGDGIVDSNEECDDSNTIDADGCQANCTIPVCGDGILDASIGEACDDGNLISNDGCQANCQLLVDCETSQWTNFTECSASCGEDLVRQRHRNVTIPPAHGGKECPEVLTETENCGLKNCAPLSSTEKTIAAVFQTLGCVWILVCVGATTVGFFVLRIWNLERLLHFCQEISMFIGHLFVLTLRDIVEEHTVCTIAGICFQYFFLVYFTFLPLEAVQSYCLATNVISVGGLLNIPVNLAIGWGLPAIITGISAGLHHGEYVADFSCWLNLGHEISLASLIPVGLAGLLAIIIAEAAGQGEHQLLPSSDKGKVLSAQLSVKGILLKTPLSIAHWFGGLFAIYYQNLGLFTIVFILNISMGVAIFVLHTAGCKEVRQLFSKLWNKIKCWKSSPSSSSSELDTGPAASITQDRKSSGSGDGVGPATEESEKADSSAEPAKCLEDKSDVSNQKEEWEDLYRWVSNGKLDDAATTRKVAKSFLFEN